MNSNSTSPRRGYGQLAGRMTRWTSNLLATAVVVALVVGLGRHFLDWDEAASLSPRPEAEELPLLDSPEVLEFGGAGYRLSQEDFRGQRSETVAALQDRCRQTLLSAESSQVPPATARLQAILQSKRPLEEQDEWAIFAFEGDAPLIVGAGAASDDWRVLAWGMAVPAGENRWRLYHCRRSGDPANRLAADALPLPPGAKTTLTLRSDDGAATIGFSGSGAAADWRAYFDEWFASHGYDREQDWRVARNRSFGRFHRDGRQAFVRFQSSGPTLRGIATLPATLN